MNNSTLFFQTNSAWITLGVIALMFIMFLKEIYSTEIVALIGVSALLILGILPYESAVMVFSNPAPWTIAAMFIIVGALVRTGALNSFTQLVERQALQNPTRAIFGALIFVAFASSIMNNTPLVVVMIPVFIQLSRTLGTSASKLLIPLSYAAIVGGTLTLLGTSTNLLVDGVARASGLEPFGIFEIFPIGIVVVSWTFLYLYFAGPKLLPDRLSMATLLTDKSKMRFFAEVTIPTGSSLIGSKVTEIPLFKRDGVRLIDVIRKNMSLRDSIDTLTLRKGDHIVLRTAIAELLSLQATSDLRDVDQISSTETITVEVLITPNCKMVGHTFKSLHLRRNYAVYTLAVHRRDTNIEQQIDTLRVKVGDTLLLEGASEDIARLAEEMNLGDVSKPSERAFRRNHAWIAITTLFAVVILAALNIAPILFLAIIGMTVVLMTKCIDADEAFSFIDGRLLSLIFAMLCVGAALQSSGAVNLIANAISPIINSLPPFFIVLTIYLISSVLTELVSNNAVAVLMTPIAIGLATSLGLDPRPLVVSIMIAASASFSTPIGYQTNTLIYGPGGYKFVDFLRFGIPLNLSLAPIVSFFIPLIWPL
ncbi:SLC13 family permease [Amylibacter sp.]|nr:SLC13 family permease [Amylibacter sp.]